VAIFNRRNALVGWLAWAAAKRMGKRKAKQAVPSIDPESKRPNKPAIVAALAAVGGALLFWRKRGGDGDATPGE
jgi:hypothetical protein